MSIYISAYAQIGPQVQIEGNAHIRNFARIYGHTVLKDQAAVSGNARVTHCTISGNAWVRGRSTLQCVTISTGEIMDLHWWRDVP